MVCVTLLCAANIAKDVWMSTWTPGGAWIGNGDNIGWQGFKGGYEHFVSFAWTYVSKQSLIAAVDPRDGKHVYQKSRDTKKMRDPPVHSFQEQLSTKKSIDRVCGLARWRGQMAELDGWVGWLGWTVRFGGWARW